MSAGAPRPVADGLFAVDGDGPRLIGARCAGCDTLYFPQVATCRNPACDAPDVAETLLPDRGTLYSYTIQRYQPPALFRMDNWAPYALGLVDLGAGLRVMAMLDQVAHDDIRIGMPLRLVVGTLYIDDDGTPVQTYKFTPDGASA